MGRTRPKKLTSKASIPIVREDEIDIIEDEVQNSLQQIETGVEKAEESEFHLQAAINATAQGKVNEAHIPTPETVLSNLRYDELYPPIFSQPATYIRFSSTVEDCCGCPYNMTEEDDVFLKIRNQKRDASAQCTEDQFEEVMYFFEETAQTKQPFAAVDNPPVLSFAEMQESMDATVEESVKRFAKDIYDHWKARRTTAGNRSLLPNLKFETGQDTDDTDPYVCFRRREVRQIRKTRGRDAQSADKLRRLRKELEDARQLVALVRQRELARKEMLTMERQIFLQRSEVKEMKRKLNIKDDDEDLINQKPKKKPTEAPAVQRPAAPQLRMPPKPGTQAAEDLQLLEDVQAEKENEILRDIKQNIAKHIKWNEGYVDLTRAPLSPPPEKTFQAAFRPAITTQLPTPPSSDSSDNMMLDTALDTTNALSFRDKLVPRTWEMNEDTSRIPSFRRRIGRGGRLFIDRRNLVSRCRVEMDPLKADRFKFDREDSDEESDFECDQYDIQIMQHRAIMAAKARDQAAAAAQAQAAHAQAQAQAQRRLQAEQTAASNGPANVGQTMGSNPGPGAVATTT
ncbi:enhancer of polycomb-like protein 1 [Aspergillus clavatus NRRL 1]|uniref:Enhancer of polycomb-like protein n=1 Tax=Aspergillus clavatus (strain ATCC 1007 / CBS 513.65 / DSM 816 / NCTC 3887 / NRRL 1 / QM 1276 / 107) TaxID=344612 RepID=A1CM96_ASPCL|nr:histone acetyltransferase complex component Epl1, putative [Aspergillus clavatus NRRL 1]EAW08683.1 histone acetyltransferase complex component Epl1, putative [Aspergillus clavatus NRRL 1]